MTSNPAAPSTAMQSSEKRFLKALRGEPVDRPPIWLMRQAGRYLPEYKERRAVAGSFLDLCYTPEHAIEVTLQPIRRFGFDASILFSDILVIPDALGQNVRFEEGVGPVLEPITTAAQIDALDGDRVLDHLMPVFKTISGLRAALPDETALIGFAGAPWTVATYMVGGRGSPDQGAAKALGYSDPETFQRLIDLLTEVTGDYLIAQVVAGAEALQIFDTWAGSLPAPFFRKWCLEPMRRLRARLADQCPNVPVIGFPKGVGASYETYIRETGINAISIDTGVDPVWAAKVLQPLGTVQGNLDPLALVAGGETMRKSALHILDTLGHGPFVFNLGHGIVPHTPPEHVGELVELVKGWKP